MCPRYPATRESKRDHVRKESDVLQFGGYVVSIFEAQRVKIREETEFRLPRRLFEVWIDDRNPVQAWVWVHAGLHGGLAAES